MNDIILRGRPMLRLRAFVLIIGMTLAFLLPVFHTFDCDTPRNRWKCETYNAAGPYLAPFVFLAFFVPFRRFLLGQPVAALSREGIDVCIYSLGAVPWTDIEDAQIKRIRFAKTLLIRRKPNTIPPREWSLAALLSLLVLPDPCSDLQISQVHIDRPLEHLKHWIDEGLRNAANGVSPDPFFTPPD